MICPKLHCSSVRGLRLERRSPTPGLSSKSRCRGRGCGAGGPSSALARPKLKMAHAPGVTDAGTTSLYEVSALFNSQMIPGPSPLGPHGSEAFDA